MNSRKGFRPPAGKQPSQGEINKLVQLFNQEKHQLLVREARSFLQRYPAHPFGPKALSASLIQLGNIDEAVAYLLTATRRFTQDAELFSNLAAALIKQGRPDLAIDAANQAIKLDPRNSGALSNRGLAHKLLGAWSATLESYRSAIELNPNDADNLNNAGIALLEMELPQEALPCFEAALALNPAHQGAHNGLAVAQEQLHFLDQAKAQLTSYLQAQPFDAEARTRLINILKTELLFDEEAHHRQILLQQLRDNTSQGKPLPFWILGFQGSTLADHQKAAENFIAHQLSVLVNLPPLVNQAPESISCCEHRPLRIGYLSSDFHAHATLMLLIGVLESHNKENVEIYCYSHGPDDGSALRKRLEAAATVFRNIKPLSHLEAARQIAADQIDILVDLKGYTKDSRLEICALRPAPVIVSWLGYPGTLGHRRLADYVIGDPIVTPLEHQPYYSETLALLPHCYQPNDNHKEIGPKPSRQALGLPENALVFCCFNQTYKITQPVLAQWCRLLLTVPDSVLWLRIEKEAIRQNLLDYAARAGVSADRFVFATGLPIHEHLGRLQQADIALDNEPYGSHTTGSDALWAGVPLIAICGQTFPSRVSTSLLRNLGLDELVAESAEQACDLAIALAQDRSRLAALRQRLAEARTTTPLFDTQGFTRDLERLYRAIWNHHRLQATGPVVLPPYSPETA